MKNSFKIFTLLFFSPILFIIVVSVLGILLEAVLFVLNTSLYFLITIGVGTILLHLGAKIAEHYKIQILKAKADELRREDDVLLQSVTFSAAIVFFYVNFLVEDYLPKLALSIFIVLFASVFYALRAWGKIKESPKYRHLSILFLAALLGAYFASFVMTAMQFSFDLDRANPVYNVVLGITVAMFLCLIFLFERVFSKRYDYRLFDFD
ncbi:hypothetical protein JW988_02245 [Candidatus Bathyarchaeota archaeon]|nr:hypothetical protein [Candidatus Bathyarchaeota archaeon]